MNPQALRFHLGLFVLAALILLAVLIVLFGGFPDLFTSYHHYTVRFDSASGVAPGTPVRRSGVRIGQVQRVELDNETAKVLVRILVERKYTVRPSDQAVLVHGLLGGDTAINFVARKGNGQAAGQGPLAEGETIDGVTQADMASLVNQASGLMPPAQDTLQEIRRAAQTLDRMAPLMEDTLREYRGVARATRNLLPELQELTRESRRALPELRRTAEEAQVTAQNWGKLGERLNVLLQTNEDKLEKVVDNLNRTLAGTANVFTEENQRNLNRTLTGLANVLGEDNQRNLAATLQNVRAGSEPLESVTKNSDQLIKESRQTLRRADDVLADLQQATKPLPDRSQRILRNLDEGTDRFNKLLGDLRELLRAAATGDSTLCRFLLDPSLYKHCDEAACLVNRVLPQLDQILRDVKVFTDKIARHPESLGLGGMVRPSAGLKEGPSSFRPGWPPGH
jgi:ABC-type transporter Mla subunit MlaD